MTASTLISIVLANKTVTSDFIAVIAAVILVVATPSRRYTLAVSTTIFGFRACTVFAFANSFGLVAVVTAIVSKVAKPLLWHASFVAALEFGIAVTLRTILRKFVRTIATIVLAVAEQPFWYATIVRMTGTTLPARGTIFLTTYVSRLVAVVAAVVVEIAHPQFRYALAVLAGKFCIRVARSVMTNGWIFVTSVLAIGIAVALPRRVNASTVGFALEFKFGTFE